MGMRTHKIRSLLSFALIIAVLQITSVPERASALGPAPTITFDATSGVVQYTGTGGGYATGIGSTVTFTISLSGLTSGTAPRGQVRVTQEGGGNLNHVFCSSSEFSFSVTSATATCSWKVEYTSGLTLSADYLTDPTTSTDYAPATSTNTKRIYVASIYGVSGIPQKIDTGTSFTISAGIYQDFGGTVSFFANGVALTTSNNNNVNCQNKTVTAAVATCVYKVPTDASALTFTFDYTPGTSVATGLTKQVGSYPVQTAVGAYYFPNESTWDGNTTKAYGSGYDLSYLNANFYKKDGIFYKLNAARGQAMVVSYDTGTITTTLSIPATFTVNTFASGSFFNRTYSVTQIGTNAFRLDSNPPTTLLTSITLPNTLTLIRGGAFNSQCKVSTLVIPDSVRIIGSGALAYMAISNSITGCSSAAGATGLNSLTIGSGIQSFGNNALQGSQNVSSLTFKGSPGSLVPYLQDPSNFDGFQYAGNKRVDNLDTMNNACRSIINYTGLLTGYLLGSQASAWRFWATANSCIPNGNLTIVNSQFAPSPPPQPIADTPTMSSLLVSWQAPVNTGDASISGYSIQYSSDGGATWTQTSCTACQIGDSPLTVTGLTPATSYIFRVIATNSVGASSPSIPSVPISTLDYSNAPLFSITPANETVTVGSAINYQINITNPAASYSITPTPRNGLSFNTTTGVLSGTAQSVETAVAYAVTGLNPIGSRTETYTVTVNAAPIRTYTPDPEQTSSIISVSQKCIKPDNIIELKGNFNAKVVSITINEKSISESLWSQSSDLISIKWAANLNTNIEIQLYNGQVPLLMVQKLTYIDQCVVEQVKQMNTQPTVEMRKISIIYFPLGSYLVGKSNKDEIAKIASQIMSSSVKTVLIYGHTDSQGGVNNTILSKNRAKAIVAEIKPLLPGKSISIGWYAATKPAIKGKNPAAYAKNRRVEIWVK